MPPSVDNYWSNRAVGYDSLQWVTKKDRVLPFLREVNRTKPTTLLDVGCGTGVITSRLPGKVVGIDNSEDMIGAASVYDDNNWDDLTLVVGDARALPFIYSAFSTVCMRMSLHHIVDGTEDALAEAHRVLMVSGRIVIEEGIPPSLDSYDWWEEMFRLKEERLVFLPEDVEAILLISGFSDICYSVHTSRRCSVMNWLNGSGLSQNTVDKIYKIHRKMPPHVARAHNAVFLDDDALIDMKFVVVTGEKK